MTCMTFDPAECACSIGSWDMETRKEWGTVHVVDSPHVQCMAVGWAGICRRDLREFWGMISSCVGEGLSS